MAELVSFFSDVSRATWIKLLVLSAISACANAAVLALVNFSISEVGDSSQVHFESLFAFLIAIACFGYAHRALINGTTRLAEDTIHTVRVRLLERIQSINLIDVEKLNIEEVYVCVNSEMQVISDAAFTFATIGEQTLILVFTFMYLAWLSIIGFFCAIVFVSFVTVVHLRRNSEINKNHQHAFELESDLIVKFSDLLYGFKEVKINALRSIELVEVAKKISRSIFQAKIRLNQIVANNHINAQIAYFAFVTAIVFVVPQFGNSSGSKIAMAAVSALFLIGPAFSVINTIPSLQKTNAAAKAILSVEARLGDAGSATDAPELPPPQFERISLHQVTYKYCSAHDAFQFGPIDLDIRRGQIVFITGGNGSGKSTLLKLLTGLYFPDDGELHIDTQPVNSANIASYRSLFSAIFSDNYLFKTLYGIPEPDPSEVLELLRLMEIEQKTNIVGKTFGDINLSTGQRKRLAMIALVLERRPICVFDEWAADQDVYFRQKFYCVILPWLRSLGKTIIAVTHDEKYFDAADQRIHLTDNV